MVTVTVRVRARIGVAVVVVGGLIGGTGLTPAGAAPPRRVWQDLVDTASVGKGNSVALDHGRAFTAAFTKDVGKPSGTRHYRVRAVDAKTGALLWQDLLTGGRSDARAVSAHADTVAVAGTVTNTTNHSRDFFVRAYDAATGAVRWSDEVDTSGGADTAEAVVVAGDRVFASGWGGTCTGFAHPGCAALLRAYNAETGALLWSAQFAVTPGFNVYQSVTATDGRVIVTGAGDNPAGGTSLLVQSFSPATGANLWTVFQPAGPADQGFAAASSVVADEHRVLVAGQRTPDVVDPSGPPPPPGFAVWSFSTDTGTPEWRDVIPSVGGPDSANGLAMASGRVVVAGQTSSPAGDSAYLVRTYQAATGAVVWSDHFQSVSTNPTPGDQQEWAQSVAINDNRAYVVGRLGPFCSGTVPSNCDLVVRAYNLHAGTLLWSDSYDRVGGDDSPGNTAIAAQGDRVVTTGVSATADGSAVDELTLGYRA